jgi:hypothetical protein
MFLPEVQNATIIPLPISPGQEKPQRQAPA